MNAVDFVQSCTMNFELDPKTMSIKTPLNRGLTMSGCGWDEGEQSYHLLRAEKLLTEVENCLKNKKDKSRVWVEGTRCYSRYEVDGGVVEGIIPGSETEEPVKAEIEIDVADRRITLLGIV